MVWRLPRTTWAVATDRFDRALELTAAALYLPGKPEMAILDVEGMGERGCILYRVYLPSVEPWQDVFRQPGIRRV